MHAYGLQVICWVLWLQAGGRKKLAPAESIVVMKARPCVRNPLPGGLSESRSP